MRRSHWHICTRTCACTCAWACACECDPFASVWLYAVSAQGARKPMPLTRTDCAGTWHGRMELGARRCVCVA
eukprot:scaffold92624_cov54-Phaeocystis_antarctica.AAC.5